MIPYHDYEGAEYEYPPHEEEPMTNFENITKSEESLAEWLGDTFDLCGAGCSKCFIKELCFDEHNNKMPGDLILDWLKQQHRG